MEKIKIITVLKSGPDWPAEYVYNFKKGIDKHITVPNEFICISDLSLDVTTLPLNDIGQNFWCKLQMFRPEFNLTGPCLYFDLDTVIVSNIDAIINSFLTYDFLMLEDPWIKGSSSSAMMWWNGDYSFLWNEYVSLSESYWSYTYRPKNRYGDQAYIMERVKHQHIQSVIPNLKNIQRFNKSNPRDELKIWQFGSSKLKPWLFLDDPSVAENWL